MIVRNLLQIWVQCSRWKSVLLRRGHDIYCEHETK